MRSAMCRALLLVALGLWGCDEAPRPNSYGMPPISPDVVRFGVVSSDWSATSIALLDAAGEVLVDPYLHSGSQPAGLVTALSGDLELPDYSGEQGVIVLLDRYRTDVITRIRLSDGKVLGQIKTHTPPSQMTRYGFSSNPHDYVRLDEHTAWVSRFEPNLNPALPPIERGNDLLRVDPSTMERTDERIDLSVLDGTVMRVDPDSGEAEEVHVFARPSSIALVGNTLVVGLARMAFDFSAIGEGMVGIVDLTTRKVKGVALEGFASCTSVARVPSDEARVLVSCAGFFAGDRRKTAGLVLLEVRDGDAEVVAAFRSQEHPDAPPFSWPAVSLGGTLVAAVANDWSGETPDVFAVLDLASGAYTPLATHEPGAGVYGTPAFDEATGLLLLPDASVDRLGRPIAGVRRFARQADGSFVERELVRVAEDTLMPARHVVKI